MKEDVAVLRNMGEKGGKDEAWVAVGDPTIIEFVVLNARQIRIVGLRMGTTDFSLTTRDNRTYGFEVRVVADLHVLQRQLERLFPDAKNLKLGQIRDHVVVEG